MTVHEEESKRLSELKLPDDALVVGVLRENRVLFPLQNIRIEDNDLLLTLVADQKVADAVTEQFSQE